MVRKRDFLFYWYLLVLIDALQLPDDFSLSLTNTNQGSYGSREEIYLFGNDQNSFRLIDDPVYNTEWKVKLFC